MANQINQSTSSALEAAAMDLESTSKSSPEPIINTNGSTPSQNVTYNGINTSSPAQAGTSMADDNQSKDDPQKSNVSAVYGNYDDFQLLPDAPWPPPIFIKQNITPQERYYIEHRWYSQWSFFDSKATENKNRYYRTQLIVGIGSVSVPVLVGINAVGIAQQILYFVTVFISLSVAMATAIESLYTFGDNWRSYRSAAEDMRQEKSLYDVKAGKYANNRQAFIRFVERCEEIIAQQNGRWVQSQEKAAEQIREDVADMDGVTASPREDQFGNAIATPATTAATNVAVTAAPDMATPVTESYTEVAATVADTYTEATPPVADTYTEAPTSTDTYADATPPTENYEGMDTQNPAGPTSYG